MHTKISNFFIDNYFKSANPSFILVYVLLLRLCENGRVSVPNAADLMGVMETDIRRALSYWAENGIIKINGEENGVLSLEFPSEERGAAREEAPVVLPRSAAVAVMRPVYTPEEIRHCMGRSERLRGLFKLCESHMGKLLSDNDMCVIFSLHDWLGLPIDVIALLVEYCCSNEHRSIRYIEKVAVVWADAGINTPEKARERIKLYNKDYRRIMAALGKAHREPVKAEEEFMLKWLKAYKLPIEVVESACEKTVLQASRPTFKYADGIIERWVKRGVTSIEGVERLDEEFRAKETEKPQTSEGGNAKSAKTKFSNFSERESANFSEIQRLEMERIEKELGMLGNDKQK